MSPQPGHMTARVDNCRPHDRQGTNSRFPLTFFTAVSGTAFASLSASAIMACLLCFSLIESSFILLFIIGFRSVSFLVQQYLCGGSDFF
jgi:hypothetical protein